MLICTNNNNNTQRKLDYTSFTLPCICGCGRGQYDCWHISCKYEESWVKIHIISHEPCPCEVCLVHIYVLGNKNLIAGLCYLLLPPIFFCPTTPMHWFVRTEAGSALNSHPHIHRHTYKHMYNSTHKMTPKCRKQTQQLPRFFSPLLLAFCTVRASNFKR